MRRNSFVHLLLGAILLAGSCALYAHDVTVGQPAPDFHATTYDGWQISLADFKGQVLVINLWATWCVPCRKELPLLDAYYAIQAKKGMAVIAVATADSVEHEALQALASKVRFPFIREMDGPYEIMRGVPTNYVIDRAGIVRYAKAGAFTLKELNDIIVPLLREVAPETIGPTTDVMPTAAPAPAPAATNS